MSNPQLSNYIRFFQILQDLESDQLITQKDKHLLKVNLTLKDFHLINLIAINSDADDDDFKYSIINYLNTRHIQLGSRPAQKIRCKSTGVEMSPIRLMGRRNSQSKENKVTEEQLVKQIEDLNESLVNILHSDNKSILNLVINEKLRTICELITRTANTSPISSAKHFGNSDQMPQLRMVDRIRDTYRTMKKQFNDYMKCQINLMDSNLSTENLLGIIKIFIKNLVDVDDLSFLTIKDNCCEFYTSSQFHTQELTQAIQNEILCVQPNSLVELLEQNFYPKLSQAFNISNFKRSYLFKLQTAQQETFFCFHQSQCSSIISSFLDLANDYSFIEEINQLATFLIETVKQARVQSFAPLQLSHMIMDIGIAFIRCSKYLFIQKSIDILSEKFHIEKHLASDDMSMISSPSVVFSQFQQRIIEYDFKDSLGVSISIQGMDLNRKEDHQVYKQLNSSFNKYMKFIKQCYDRTTYYKFFVKSQDSLIFEFDKRGQLMFVSRPVPSKLKEEYKIDFDPHNHNACYNSIFKNPIVINHIEHFLQDQNKWKLTESNSQFEVFMKMEEKTFQGFFVIFQEGWFKYDQQRLDFDQQLQNKVKKQILQQETLEYLDKLEENNPQIKNSLVQMFKPRQALKSSLFKSLSAGRHADSRSSIRDADLKLQIADKQVVKRFNYNEMVDSDFPNIDNFDFNILEYSNSWKDKQAIVLTIIRRNQFIEEFQIATTELCEFLADLEYKYNKRQNPFHNYDHGVAVMQCTYAIILQLDQTRHKDLLSHFQRMALIFSGLCHDVSHTGRTNIFEMNSLSKLAVRYHDKSVLEQHHAATALRLLCEPETNFLPNLSNEEFRKFRKLFISNILYTDITEHFNLIKNFELRSAEMNFGETEDDLKLLSGMIIHTSDFTGGAKKFEQSKQWSIRVNKEFEVQYELEGKHGYPQLPYMKDLDKFHVMAKQEAGFFKFIVRPLWASMSKFAEDRLQESVNNLEETIVEWERISQQVPPND